MIKKGKSNKNSLSDLLKRYFDLIKLKGFSVEMLKKEPDFKKLKLSEKNNLIDKLNELMKNYSVKSRSKSKMKPTAKSKSVPSLSNSLNKKRRDQKKGSDKISISSEKIRISKSTKKVGLGAKKEVSRKKPLKKDLKKSSQKRFN